MTRPTASGPSICPGFFRGVGAFFPGTGVLSR